MSNELVWILLGLALLVGILILIKAGPLIWEAVFDAALDRFDD